MCSDVGSILTVVAVQWDVDMQCGRLICSGIRAKTVKYMNTSASGHIDDCIEFI